MKTDHLLIMRFSAMGDVAMLVPVVSSLARQYPDLRITVLSRPFARPFFEELAPNVGFMEADLKGEYHGVSGLNALYRRLVAKNFTAIADMHNILRSSYLRMRFNLARYRVEHIDKHRRERRQLISAKEHVLQQLPTSFENYVDVLERLGYPVKLDFNSMFPPTGGNLRLISDRVGEKKKFQQWIGIAPFAAHEGKIYPTEKMEQVI
uniref:glycosyltransferase family 9 protein n=1 Tax=uncultured Prevotella sp. TaxID=159272 RepID=UPI0035AF33D1